ncbi:arginine--tRNA ligase [Patescibacteria group bacterium]|nr:arginine--tRNA ligase [Patescibacteria group bacterium]MBU1673778.1 arginine--tRNA ligase [Patescibacteria group bacterium]MBU1964118.1 arginine--tRNA ligase [Patescibacteria group bacterium]
MKEVIKKQVDKAIERYQKDNVWLGFALPEYQIEYPDQEKFGDYSCNVAMVIASKLRKNPREVAEKIKEYLEWTSFEKVEIAGPGFLNIFLRQSVYNKELKKINEEKQNYGKQNFGEDKKIQIEFISANPTGPLHMGNGRGGFTGDVLANVLRKVGYKPYKEYYINDSGKQIDLLGESVVRRYLQQEGMNVDYPEELYQGDYIIELAKKVDLKNVKLTDQKALVRTKKRVTEWALEEMIVNVREVLEIKCGIKFNQWFRESQLYENDNKEKMLAFLKEKDLVYLKEGAIWFKSTKFGDDKDRVVIKQDGKPTYFFSDILYADNRFNKRKYEKVIMILGADHHGDVARLQAASEILDHKGQLEVIIYQNVRLVFKGKELKMSKRKGVFVTLDELVDEVGIDAVRFFFLMNSLDKHMDFDMALAKQKSEKNPVYYVQYAHARISSILEKTKKTEMPSRLEFTSEHEKALIKELVKMPDILEEAARNREVHKLPFYAIGIARKFHNFYNHCRVIDNGEVNASRLFLIKATKQTLANVLTLMGVSAPNKM